MTVTEFAAICRDLFLVAQQDLLAARGPMRGRLWEEQVAACLLRCGVPVECVPGGYRVLGHVSLSGLAHQVDATFGCTDAVVLAEWKAHRGALPKNELLRFKAVTDDYYMAFGHGRPSRPVLRLFGGTGMASDNLRAYAALHGIALIERERWPLPFLASDDFVWPDGPTAGPSDDDRRSLSWGARPLQQVLVPQHGGGYLFPRPASPSRIGAILRLHDYWSDRLWDAMDSGFDEFDKMVAEAWGLRKVA